MSTAFEGRVNLNRLSFVLILLILLPGCRTPTQMDADAEVRRLCEMDGGVRVYETVKLPAHRFDTQGNVRIPSKERAQLTDEYYFEREVVSLRRDDPQVTRTVHKIIRRSDGKVLGTSTRYARGGGDPPGLWHPSSFICPPVSKDAPSVESMVFVRGESR